MTNKFSIVAISIIIALMIIACTFLYIQNDGSKRITALEKMVLANDLALEYSNTSKLVYIYNIGEINEDGTTYKWRYTYANESNGLEVIIDSNGGYQMNELENPPSTAQIVNLTLDSDEVIEIAYSNPTISNYLVTYPRADVVTMALGARINSSVWSIEWNDPGFMDDPHSARIWIDATNGEVIDVEADN